mmetsp:Transcript_8383/g.15984  ORF Transcript_8383/g.15984 Transcript_8383/m.15984 type:complete len:371 (-) Transcript_8383:46-1158(-)|eukprot:scaffold765_cov160-Amphora_coffeaeformis.AAC.15
MITSPLLRELKENRLQTLHIDRRSLWGNSKFSTSSLDTLDTYDSDTDDESFSSSSDVSDREEKAFWWSMLLSRISGSSKIENVILQDEVLTSPETNEESQTSFFDELLRCLPTLPNLRLLRIYISRRGSLDFGLLHEVVQACTGLQQLIICDSSSWEDDPAEIAFALTSRKQMNQLACAIRYHPSLVEVSLQECFVAPHLSLDPIVQALATLPRLEMINLTMTQSSVGRIRNSSIVRLFQVDTLQDVTLWSMGLDDQHLEAIRDVLPLHPSLVFLSLRCNPKITERGWQTLCDIVEENYVLRSVYTDEIVSPQREIMLQNFLYFNQCGRGNLLQSNDPKMWQEALVRWQNDLTALFYLVRQGHPCLSSSP